ncbi:MAG: PD-(D/E)XK nuclease family protein [Anaerolineaceae bacterium]|nr:PD-(D/E)XK nuclease family protein [Anaerolineaceae bacterium]
MIEERPSQLAEVADFFSRYRAVQAQAVGQKAADFASRFARFKTSFQQVKGAAQKQAREEAPSFNLFTVLGVSHYEVRTHSAFLASLLDPAASHGQQYAFLTSFLNVCQKRDPTFPLPKGELTRYAWHVQRERSTVRFGRLDIVLSCSDLGYLCVIENKVGAGEQYEQLSRYSQWLDTQEEAFTDRALIFLTPRGHESITSGDYRYFPLSYYDDIAPWLAGILPTVAAQNLRHALAQYLQLWQAKGAFFMTSEDPILNFLAEPGNLELAFEISEALNRLVIEMHGAFWPAVSEALAEKLEGSPEYSAYWSVDPPTNASQYFESWMSCDLVPQGIEGRGKRPYASIILQQSTARSNYWLQYGVVLAMKPKNEYHVGPPLKLLEEKLNTIGLSANPPWWIGVRQLPYYARLKEFTSRMATDRQQFMAELVGNLWQILETCHDEIVAYNQFVAENKAYEAQ